MQLVFVSEGVEGRNVIVASLPLQTNAQCNPDTHFHSSSHTCPLLLNVMSCTTQLLAALHHLFTCFCNFLFLERNWLFLHWDFSLNRDRTRSNLKNDDFVQIINYGKSWFFLYQRLELISWLSWHVKQNCIWNRLPIHDKVISEL